MARLEFCERTLEEKREQVRIDGTYDFLEGTVEVEIFHGKLTFCLPRGDFQWITDRLFDGKEPTVEEMSELVLNTTSGREDDWYSWRNIAYELHESVELQRNIENTKIKVFPVKELKGTKYGFLPDDFFEEDEEAFLEM